LHVGRKEINARSRDRPKSHLSARRDALKTLRSQIRPSAESGEGPSKFLREGIADHIRGFYQEFSEDSI